MKISLCIICKDEEKKIARCINSVSNKVDEVIVVDTGSKDKTIEIVKALNAKVFEIPWENDFSKAKNFAIEQATGDWIIFLDADEYIAKGSLGVLRQLIKEAHKKKKDCILCEMLNEQGGEITTSFKTNRIFKNSPKIRYKGRIHERLYKINDTLQMIEFLDQIKIMHDGYSEEVVCEKNKLERNITLLLEELKNRPTSSDIYYYLMQSYIATKEWNKAWECGEMAIKYNQFELVCARSDIYEMFLNLCNQLSENEIKTKEIYERAIQENGEYPDFDFRYGKYLYDKEYYDECIGYFKLCINKIQSYTGYAISRVTGNIVLVFELLVNAYLLKRDYESAIPILVKILRINPYRAKELYNLINILQTQESGSTIGAVLKNLYDYNNIKDQILLLQISKEVQNEELYNYVLAYADEALKEQLELINK